MPFATIRRRRPGFTLLELLVVIAIIAILIALLVPAVQKVREAAARTHCMNNVKQIALAMHNHEGSFGFLPYSKRSSGAQRSWVPDLLPYLEQANMVNKVAYNLDEPWWRSTTNPKGPTPTPIPNSTTVQMPATIFMCPSTQIQPRMQNKQETPPEQNKIGACGDYFVPEGVNFAINAELPVGSQFTPGPGLFGALREYPNKNKFAQFIDGTSNTILIGECAGREDVWRAGKLIATADTNKKSPTCARARGGAWATNDNPYEIGQRVEWCTGLMSIPGPMKINNSNEWGHLFYSFHSQGAVFALADGSVRFLSDTVSLHTLACLTTRAGGEPNGNDY